jgi:hypothetical protein
LGGADLSRPASYVFTDFERSEINRFGRDTGCHTCGARDPGTRTGNWIADHQLPGGVNWKALPQRLYPHCLSCKKMQAFTIKDIVTRTGRSADFEASPSCTIFVSDILGGEIPEPTRVGNCWFTSSCVAIGCISFMDGEAKVTLNAGEPDAATRMPVFDGFINTPRRLLIVSTPENNILLRSRVPNIRTRVRIFTNHPSEPDKIDIFFDQD